MTKLTREQQVDVTRTWSKNPFMRSLCEAMVTYETCGTLDGFTSSVARENIRKRFGDDGAERWDDMVSKIVEALGETTDPRQLE